MYHSRGECFQNRKFPEEWSWSVIRLMRLPASGQPWRHINRIKSSTCGIKTRLLFRSENNCYILLDSSRGVLYLYWDILKTAEEIVTVQAVQIVTSVNLKNSQDHFQTTGLPLDCVTAFHDLSTVYTHWFSELSLRVEGNVVYPVRDTLPWPLGRDGGGAGGGGPAGGGEDVRELITVTGGSGLCSAIEDSHHQDWNKGYCIGCWEEDCC